jgi:hypothetical protein
MMPACILQKLSSKKYCRCLRWILVFAPPLLCLGVSVPPAFGQVSIVPLVQEISVNRGGRTRFQLQIANRGSELLSCTMQIYNLDISEEGIPRPIREETKWSCLDWITFAPRSFQVQPDEVQIVEGLLHASQDALGGYYAFITCEFSIPAEPVIFGNEQKSQADVQFGRAVSSVLLVSTRSSKNYVQLEPESPILVSGREVSGDTMPDWTGQEAGESWQVVLPVVNAGNVHTVAQGEVSIWTEDIRLVEKAPLIAGRGYVLPGKKRVFKAQGTRSMADGIYMVRVQIRTREGKFIQNSFPYSIVKGEVIQGPASEDLRALIEASTPKFTLSKRLLDYKVTAKGKRTKGIRLTNHTSDTLSVSARMVSWSLDSAGRVVLNPDASELTKPCVSWISVLPNPIPIPPKRSGAVKVTLTVPPEIEGEYYGGVVFETQKPRQNLPTELELARTLLLMASSAKDLEHKAEIASFVYYPISPMMRTFVVTMANNGNVHCFASGKVEIYDKEWKPAMEPVSFGGPQSYILPERSRAYVVPCPGALEPGIYEAVVTVKYHEEQATAVAKINFEAEAE